MMLTRKELEKQEYKTLAPYAMKSKETRGRVHKEKEHDYRSVYQRDKDRIVYSTAFRRLEYKTQVFVNHEGDHYRTRLTHTLEVSQLARTIARTLKLNEDLAEAIAPGVKQEITGIRPGEKLHETLISLEESVHTTECDDYYVIEPEFPFWNQDIRAHGSKKMIVGEFTSLNNDKWLTQDDLKSLIATS